VAVTKIDLASQSTGVLPTTTIPGLTGDVTSSAGTVATTVVKINGTTLSSLATGILKNTTGTGVPSIAAAGTDYLTPSGSSAALSVGSSSAFGVLKVDGTTITAAAGVITAVGSSGTLAPNETPSGTINGSNATFTLAHTPINTSLMLFLNGILQDSGAGNDYTLATATITMLNVPATGDKLRAFYSY
jgi:hypothetical protein